MHSIARFAQGASAVRFAAAVGPRTAGSAWRGWIVGALAAAALFLLPAFARAAAPVTVTGEASATHFNRATVQGTVNPEGVELEECLFEYGATETYGQSVPCQQSPGEIGTGSGPVSVEAQATNLNPTTEYHFRLVAKSSAGTDHGADGTFITLEAPVWNLTVTPNAEYVLPGGEPGVFKIEAENVGGDETSGPITIEDFLPPGLSPDGVQLYYSALPGLNLPGIIPTFCPTEVKCTFPLAFPFSVHPHQKLIMLVRASVSGSASGTLEDKVKISGGGILPAESTGITTATAEPAFGTLHFEAALTDSSRHNAYTQAGGHPFDFITELHFETYTHSTGSNDPGTWRFYGAAPVGDPKEVSGELPPGLIANPQGVPHCLLAEYFGGECSRSTQVGSAGLRIRVHEAAFNFFEPIYNLQPSGEFPGELGITIGGAPFIVLTTGIRDGSDYGVTSSNVAIQSELNRVRLVLWGVPADPAHDPLRGRACTDGSGLTWAPEFMDAEEVEQACGEGIGTQGPGGGAAEVPPTPFITMPTECSGEPLEMKGKYNSWQAPGQYAEDTAEMPAVDGCNALAFEPTIEARPTTNLADAPSGLEFNLQVPQNEDPEGVATPELKEAIVRLPKGLTLNPAAAAGLEGCSEAQAALHVEAAPSCPDASKLGTAEVDSPLLNETLTGSVYLATPYHNPFGSLLAGYIYVTGQGIRIKLPGRFEADAVTGQITTKFLENPQLPFEELRLRLFEGAHSVFRTPATCGTYETTTVLTPFSAPESGPPAEPAATFNTDQNGAACPSSASQLPNAPRLRAGTEAPLAGVYSPFSLRLVREDGSQEFKSIETTLSPGLLGRLAGIPYCSDSAIAAAGRKSGIEEKASPSCPASAEVGTVAVSAGAGPTPLYVPGHVYLTGPYKGAPISLTIITPAVAGPFDLGTVVVRTALYVNPETTQIHAVSDPIPTILEGIPLDLRSVTLKASRPKFTLNPTSCEESAFTGSALSVLNVAAPLTQRFQVGGCPALGFKPRLALRFKGGTKRRGHPAITAVLQMPAGGANIAATQVAFSSTELLDNAHIDSPCTRVEFAAGACPAGSILGHARAETPLLDQPLEGNVYLMTGFGHKLPDLVADLNGQIHVVLDGRIDQFHGGLRTTFEAVPDAPVSKFVLALKGGAKGLVQNSVNLCKSPQRATAVFEAQNGKSLETRLPLKVRCRKGAKKHGNHHRAGRRAG